MGAYNKFASIYAQGGYSQYSMQMARLLPAMLQRFNAEPKTILDVACGEGTFVVAMASKGYEVTGVDLSPEMIAAAQEQARNSGVSVNFKVQDMRSMDFGSQFDLVTCWFDSLNYLLTNADLTKAFKGVARALRHEGLFIFDMNTIHGLAFAYWQYPPVRKDEENLFMIHRFTNYDHDKNIVTMKITSFIREGGTWERFDEEHLERGYTLAEIRKSLKEAGLTELACWGHPSAMTDPQQNSSRVWFVARK